MQVKSIDDLIDEFEVEINTELNDPIKSKTGEDILEEVEGAKRRTEVLNLRIIQANQQTSSPHFQSQLLRKSKKHQSSVLIFNGYYARKFLKCLKKLHLSGMLKLAPRKKVENLPLYNNVIKCYETEYKCVFIGDIKMYFQWTPNRSHFFGEALC